MRFQSLSYSIICSQINKKMVKQQRKKRMPNAYQNFVQKNNSRKIITNHYKPSLKIKKIKFDIDLEKEDLNFTHNGQFTLQSQKFMPSDDQQFNQQVNDQAKQLMFSESNHNSKKSKKQIYDQLIKKSKLNKKIKQMQHEKNIDKIQELNQKFKILQPKYEKSPAQPILFDFNEMISELKSEKKIKSLGDIKKHKNSMKKKKLRNIQIARSEDQCQEQQF